MYISAYISARSARSRGRASARPPRRRPPGTSVAAPWRPGRRPRPGPRAGSAARLSGRPRRSSA
eukprot:5850848-Heterocapsa_arctica.AAC.1